MEIRLYRGLSECPANRNIIFRLYRFSFHKPIKSKLVRGCLYLPFTTHKSTTKSATLRYGTHGYLWVLPFATWIDGFSQPEYCMLHSLGLIKNRTDFLVPLPATTSGSVPENKQFYFLYFYILCWHAIRHNLQKSVTPPTSAVQKQTSL